MKLQLVLATALLAISATSVQAADTRTPDILASVSAGAVQALSQEDAGKTRGQYRLYSGSTLVFILKSNRFIRKLRVPSYITKITLTKRNGYYVSR